MMYLLHALHACMSMYVYVYVYVCMYVCMFAPRRHAGLAPCSAYACVYIHIHIL